MIAAGVHTPAITDEGHRVLRPWFPMRPRSNGTALSAYTYILDGNIQLLRDGFVRPWRFYLAAVAATRIAKRFRPDVLIGDFSLLTWVVGKRLGLPVVQIAQSISHPVEPRIIWWEDPPVGAVSPDIRPVVNPILTHWNIPAVSRAEDLLKGDLYLIPNIPELEPVQGGGENTHYTGAFVVDESRGVQRRGPEELRHEDPFVYVTLGGGSSPVGNVRFYEMLNRVFEKTPWRVVISTGRKFEPSLLSSVPSNISYHQWVDGLNSIRQCDVVLFHGGHATMMETVHCGTPSVIIPFHSEQEGNGRRLEAYRAAKMLRPTDSTGDCNIQRFHWKYGEYAVPLQAFVFPPPEVLQKTISEVLENDCFRQAAKRLSLINEQYGGSALAAQIVNNLV